MSKGFDFLNIDLSKGLNNPPAFILEFPYEVSENYSPVLKEYWGDVISNPVDFFRAVQQKAKSSGAKAICIYFNIQEPQETEKDSILLKCNDFFKSVLKICDFPLMVRFSGHGIWDIELAKVILPICDRELIISPVQSANYEELIKIAKATKFNHYFVLRTPIDINLTKELNILSIDAGVSEKNILIDPEMGCIGYGIDYGYSIIERICLARKDGDKMLDMPIIVCAGEESYKAKESKSFDFSSSWGELTQRAKMWEISTASSLIAAGANIIVMWHPECIEVLKKQHSEVLCH